MIFLLIEIALIAFLSRRSQKYAFKVFLLGLALITFERLSIFLCVHNGEYFHLPLLDQLLKISFAWENVYLAFILGVMMAFAGLMGLWIRPMRESVKPEGLLAGVQKSVPRVD
jgi:hypothetical protein